MRGSFVTPLLLILAGGLFLYNNLNPDVSIWRMISQNWPYLLIGWGFVRLAEILLLASQNKPLPRRGIGVGEFSFIVLLTMVGSGLFFANDMRERVRSGRVNFGNMEIFNESFEYPVTANAPCPRNARIIVENRRGNARIVGVDGDQIQVSGHNTVRSADRQQADRVAEKMKLEINTVGDQVIIRSNQENASSDARVDSELEIRVPKGVSVECRGTYGDFDVSNISGGLDVNSDNAGVRGQEIGGNVRVNLRRSDIVRLLRVKGNVDIKTTNKGEDVELDEIAGLATVDGTYTGTLDFRRIEKPFRFNSRQTDLSVDRIRGRVHTSDGDMEIEDVSGPLRLRSKSKDLRITNFTSTLDIELDRGDIEVSPGRTGFGVMNVKTSSGELVLHLPEGAKFDLDAVARRGEVDNGFGSPLRSNEEDRGGSIRGGNGGPKLKLQTDRGRLSVVKGSVLSTRSSEEEMVAPETPKAPKAPAPPSLVDR
jgi:DUF4097 and DUF4098 domain-containing protein YvlB